MRKLIFAATVLALSWSNIFLEWGNAYVACLMAVVVGYAVDVAYVLAYHKYLVRR